MRQPRDKYCSNFPLAASNNPKYGGEGFSGLKITHNQCLGLNGLEYTFYGISVATYTPRLIMYQYELHTKYKLQLILFLTEHYLIYIMSSLNLPGKVFRVVLAGYIEWVVLQLHHFHTFTLHILTHKPQSSCFKVIHIFWVNLKPEKKSFSFFCQCILHLISYFFL